MIIICIVIGYLLGSILTAEIVSKAKGKNVRQIDPTVDEGKGNPGMANVMINLGFKPGVLVFIGDALKTVLTFVLVYLLFKDVKLFLYAGFGALLGHDFSFLYHFDGGKGVLVTIIWLIAIMPIYSWIVLVICAIVVLVTGMLNLSAVLLPLVAIPFAFVTLGIPAGIILIIVSLITVYRNRRDIRQMLDGTYHRVYLFKKKN